MEFIKWRNTTLLLCTVYSFPQLRISAHTVIRSSQYGIRDCQHGCNKLFRMVHKIILIRDNLIWTIFIFSKSNMMSLYGKSHYPGSRDTLKKPHTFSVILKIMVDPQDSLRSTLLLSKDPPYRLLSPHNYLPYLWQAWANQSLREFSCRSLRSVCMLHIAYQATQYHIRADKSSLSSSGLE